MATERIKLFEADIDVEGIIKKSSELKSEFENLKSRQKELKDSGDTVSETYVKLEARLKNVSTEYRINQKQLSNLTSETGGTVTITQKLDAALSKEVVTVSAAAKNNAELKKIRNEVNATTEEGQKAIADINKKLNENTAFIKSNVSELENQKIGIGGYKEQIKEAYNEMNIFNGGFTGFIARAQQAGGVLPLLGKGIKGITSGIFGMTKASLAFIVTPIGAVIAALGVVIGGLITYLKSTQAGIDKVTAVTRPLQAIFQSLIGVVQKVGETMFKAFTNPKKALTDLVDYVKNNVMNRFKAFGVILEAIENRDFKALRNGIAQGITGIENLEDKIVDGAKATANFLKDAAQKGAEIDRLQKEIEQNEADMVLRRAELNKALKEQEAISKDQSLTDAVRSEAIRKQTELANELVGAENKILDLKIKQETIQQSLNDSGRKDLTKINELLAEQLANEELLSETKKKNLGAEKQLRTEAAAIASKAFEESLKRQEIEIEKYLLSQGIKKQTMAEELKLAEVIFEKALAIEKRKLAAKKITQGEYELFVLQNEKELAQKRAEIAIDNAKRELDAHIEANQSKLDSSKVLTDLLVNEELARLTEIAAQREQFERERFDQGLINETEYQDNILTIQKEALDKAKELNDQYEIQKKEDAQIQKAIEFQEELERMETEGASKYEIEKERLLSQYAEDTARLEEQREQGLITEAEYNARRKALDIALKDSLKANSDEVAENRIALAQMTYSNLAAIMGKESAAGKAMAIAQATIDTYKAAVAAFAAGSSLGGPAGVIMGPVSAAIAVAAGMANIKKIASTKPPKAEKGMALNIGGRRHAQGGTKFYGEDGTHFEAEAGEKMFILNRQASAALAPLLSDINQQYGGVSLSRASSYLAAGGQVYRNPSTSQMPQFDFDKMAEVVGEGVRQGSREGSLEGSSRGTYSGIVDKETNETIAAGANF